MIIAIAGAGLAFYGLGRIGPAQQSSCCGCSCAVALVALPVGALVLWAEGGPAMAALVVPAWIPTVWALDFLARSVDQVKRTIRGDSEGQRHGPAIRSVVEPRLDQLSE